MQLKDVFMANVMQFKACLKELIFAHLPCIKEEVNVKEILIGRSNVDSSELHKNT